MIVLLSPSKTQDFAITLPARLKHTQPDALGDSQVLMKSLSALSPAKIAALMDVSEKISTLNHERFQSFALPFTTKNARQAAFAFKGDVYDGLEAQTLPPDALAFAQKHIRILSGLYGLLRPLDLIQPYRLEMKTKLRTPKASNLYDFWDERITKLVEKSVKDTKAKAVINLASEEYARAVDFSAVGAPTVTPQFKEKKAGSYQMIGLFAKKARGAMARNIALGGLTDPKKLASCAPEGYALNSALSTENKPVFTRG